MISSAFLLSLSTFRFPLVLRHQDEQTDDEQDPLFDCIPLLRRSSKLLSSTPSSTRVVLLGISESVNLATARIVALAAHKGTVCAQLWMA